MNVKYAKTQVKDVENRKREAGEALNETVDKFEQWLERFTHQTREQLVEYEKSI